MIRASLRGIWDNKIRTILLGLAVVAGVAFVAASFIFTDTIGGAFDGMFDSSTEGLDINITAVMPESGIEIEQVRLDASVADELAAIEGVIEVYPTVLDLVTILVDGDVVGSAGVPPFGSTWSGEIGGYTIAAGRAPAGPGEIAVDTEFVGRALDIPDAPSAREVQIGDVIGVAGSGAIQDYEIVGTVSLGEGSPSLGFTFVFFEFNHGAEVLGSAGQYDQIDASIDPALDVDEFVDHLNATLPPDVEVRSSQAAMEATAAQLQEGLGFISTFLLVFAGISVFVGVFVVYNAFRTVIGQRTREMALFRVVGSTRSQVVASVLIEALIIGVVASVIGLGGGILLVIVLEFGLDLTGAALPEGPLQVAPRTVLWAVGVGVLTTIFSALMPAWRASLVSPMAALTHVEKPTRGFDRRRMVSLAMVIGGAALSVGAVLSDWSIWLLSIGLVAFVLGTYLIGAFIAQPLIRLLARPLRSRVTGDLARQNAQRSPRRTASTAGALMIGVALVTAVSILTISIQQSARASIDDIIVADLVVQQGGFDALGGISDEISPIVANVPGVDQIMVTKGGQGWVNGQSTFVEGVDPSALEVFFRYEDIEGSFEEVAGNEIMIQRSRADEDALELGSRVTVEMGGREDVFEVAAIWDLSGDSDNDTSYFLSLDAYEALIPSPVDLRVSVLLDEGVDLDAAVTDLEAAIADYPLASVNSKADLIGQTESQLNAVLILIFGLLAMSVLIALIGVLLTLLLSVFERTKEIGLLRAVGMTRPQVRGMVRWESVIVALFGALLGVVVGLFLGWVLGRLTLDEQAAYTIPWMYIGSGFVAATIAGLLAAIWPARRASNLNILEAIAYE